MSGKNLVVEALELGRAYIQGIEGTIPLKPNLCTPDREKLEKAILLAKLQEQALELLKDPRALYASGPEVELWTAARRLLLDKIDEVSRT